MLMSSYDFDFSVLIFDYYMCVLLFCVVVSFFFSHQVLSLYCFHYIFLYITFHILILSIDGVDFVTSLSFYLNQKNFLKKTITNYFYVLFQTILIILV